MIEVAGQRVTRLGGVLARRWPPTASPSSRRMPEPNSGDRNSQSHFRCWSLAESATAVPIFLSLARKSRLM